MPAWSSNSPALVFSGHLADQRVRVIDQRLFITDPESFELSYYLPVGVAALPLTRNKGRRPETIYTMRVLANTVFAIRF